MKKYLVISLILIISGCSVIKGRKIRPQYTETLAPITAEQIAYAVGNTKNWSVIEKAGDTVVAHYFNKHEVIVEITPDYSGFNIEYVSSSIEYDDGRVHKNYYGWIKKLSYNIKRQAYNSKRKEVVVKPIVEPVNQPIIINNTINNSNK